MHEYCIFLRSDRMRKPLYKNPKKGVALIFFLLTFGIILGFLMLIMNTGMLVYQKMRLQTAVDLAAYAGASVQASYLGNEASGQESIAALNAKIYQRYGELLEELDFGWVAPWPQGFPDKASCAAACIAATLANGNHTVKLYKKAVSDIEVYRNQIIQILSQVSKASQEAAEATMKLNIPELSIEGDALAAHFSEVTNEVEDVVQSSDSFGSFSKKKNAVLSFSSQKGMYLANVVAAVPHVYTSYGPMCFPAAPGQYYQAFYCTVNGMGAPGGMQGYAMAAAAWARAKIKGKGGNTQSIPKASDASARAIRLQFIPNPHMPDPFFIAAAEWYPENGTAMNLENSLGAKGSLFPKQTRLVSVAAAEPFGGNLVALSPTPFGTRLQSIRKLVLDPRLKEVKDDYNGLFDYFQSLAPTDGSGNSTETAEDVARRFLH